MRIDHRNNALVRELSRSTWLPYYRAFLFYIAFAMIGWFVETFYIGITQHRLAFRGLIAYGLPIIPVYGFGGLALIYMLSPFKKSPVLLYTLSVLLMSVMEYVAGILTVDVLHIRSWNYSNMPYNLNGHIALQISLGWGVLAMIIVYVVHPPLERFIYKINPVRAAFLSWTFFIFVIMSLVLKYFSQR